MFGSPSGSNVCDSCNNNNNNNNHNGSVQIWIVAAVDCVNAVFTGNTRNNGCLGSRRWWVFV
ncbi:hypothetical protein HanXRQr2_Chr15g0721281 [Helianthus annuus]|uniref:Uncharacterized protein n=1 Tax=Helianthus annuus TaxID=4232 RepID=A0A9K3H5K7_HELAN|nr:hypothetical protein HanXRQr2_Chr15g0721281 [Helianthus annuus]KAJ0833556.1 hypothetical protein HanPSC8_Chr15g0691791 [Helianthus annuus]